MAEEQLIQDYQMEMCAPGCHPGAATWSARALLQTDISELLPLLNGYLEGADFDHGAGVYLTKEGLTKYLAAYEKRMARPFVDKGTDFLRRHLKAVFRPGFKHDRPATGQFDHRRCVLGAR